MEEPGCTLQDKQKKRKDFRVIRRMMIRFKLLRFVSPSNGQAETERTSKHVN